MLRTRVITAVAVLPVVLGMLAWAPHWLWAGFAALIALVGCWEWSRMCGLATTAQRGFLVFSGTIAGTLVALYVVSPGQLYPAVALALLWLAAAFWVVAVPVWLAKKLRPAPWTLAFAGWITLWPMWVALVDLRDRGRWLLLAAALIVWIADIAAYFAGRRFGKNKLAPAISPGKTWEGVYGALAGVLAYGLVLLVWSTGSVAPTSWWIVFLTALLALTAASIIGDLYESWIKRGAGVKDSSNLLPGHGGVLDRIDALCSTLPLAALLVSYKGV
ncbi:phosphatidate cytidylyltransferase [Usitatibacter palustris]|uniref:Phosphatidate cytidylyltransferase n=1 Tax=Usitatibacter palustris TaxID=2732487 RepID=A0A6M4H3G8_9PROT|nr:phosphatidate cytidylyltransferase [Usitatibacter palustris]QJR14151.1 Phosphatidate cytidylyltransferase [Usitatibacter palustris]